jgi:shikimate kinase/3-dehydroquinate synthase
MASTMLVFLIGFPAAGKSTVGPLAAANLELEFVDLDELIAERTGRSVAAMVAADETNFRRHEANVLASLIADATPRLIATGGGAAAWGDNLVQMRVAGMVIALAVDLDVALTRAARGGVRPLLERPRSDLDRLFQERHRSYCRAHAVIVTDDRSAEAVAADVVRVVTRTRAIGRAVPWVVLGERSYPIVVGAEISSALAGQVAPGRSALIADSNLAAWIPLYRNALAELGSDVHVEVVPAGEASKSPEQYSALAERLVAAGLDRHSTIWALGGGVVGDLAGFVAATLFRGVAVVQLPTTLVAMTDSAIGGKTAIDLPAGKNLLGAFHQPRLVYAHIPTLATLPARERRAGFGELWKYALLDGESLWLAIGDLAAWAASDGESVPDGIAPVIERCATLKAAVVSRDECERRGERALLNLGHTLGHAIEAAADWRLQHGEAVGLGLVAMARVSHRLGVADAHLEQRITEALRVTGLPFALDPWLSDDVVARVSVDKKRRGPHLGFIACAAPGDCRVIEVLPRDFAEFLRP